jgi:hypothetical protein
MTFTIINREKKKLSYSQIQQGDESTRGKGYTLKDKEIALRAYCDGASREEITDVYKQFFYDKQTKEAEIQKRIDAV